MMLKILDRYTFYETPGAPRLAIWQDWLRAHGVDPADVIVPGWIERREADRQLVWLAPIRRPSSTPGVVGYVAAFEPRVLQLESPPLPWPDLPWPP